MVEFAALPVPERTTSPGAVALVSTRSVAALAPVAVGAKFRTIVQVEPAARDALALQVELLAITNDAASDPLRMKAVRVAAPGPWLDKVRVWAALVAPTTVEENARELVLGCHASLGVDAVACPNSATSRVWLVLVTMVTAPLDVPAVVGV